jgi:hypothetical protein
VTKYKFKITRSFVVETDADSKRLARDILARARDKGIEEEYLVFESISDPAVDDSDSSGLSKTVRAISQQLFGTSNSKRN